MKVKELIKELERCDPKSDVVLCVADGCSDLDEVRQEDTPLQVFLCGE
jgi:hypothetical protein